MFALIFAAGTGCDGSSDQTSIEENHPTPTLPTSDRSESEIPEVINFNEHVAPIIHLECSVCHHPGEVAPFSLLTYRDVRKRSKQIVDVTQSGYMPPWMPEPTPPFVGERHLTPHQLEIIRQWSEQGAIEGPDERRPTPPEYSKEWSAGEPHSVYSMSESYSLIADGRDVYRNFVISTDLQESRFVRVVEFRPLNRPAIHHAAMYIDTTSGSRERDALEVGLGFNGMSNLGSATVPAGHFVSWVPGKRPNIVPDDRVWKLSPGTDLVLQIHMNPTGKPEEVGMALGFQFTDKPPSKVTWSVLLRSKSIDIPPGESEYVIEESFLLPVDIHVLSILPHAHYLGKTLRGFAKLADGSEQQLIRISDWDFNWQDEYELREPIFLPAGSTLHMHYTYDNSDSNPRNPNSPAERVRLGPMSSDEMGELLYHILLKSDADLARLKRGMARKDILEKTNESLIALRANPEDTAAQFILSRSLPAMVDHAEDVTHVDQAIEYLKEVDGIVPERGFSKYKAHFESSRKKYAQILELQNEVVANPNDPARWRKLGTTLSAMGRLELGIESLEKSHLLEPQDAIVCRNLGLAWLQKERPDKALPYLEKALSLNPEDSPLRKTLETIKR